MRRTILHSDMNAFYASVECLYRPDLQGKPVAVGGDPENRHGIILAKNQKAKEYGVRTAEALWEAYQKCPGLVVLKPNYPLYQRFSQKFRKICYEYTDLVEPFGLDENWMCVTNSVKIHGSGVVIAEEIRRRVKEELGLTVSIGVSWNKIFAKFGSDYKKPDAITVITPDNYQDIIFPQDVGDLLYVGHSTRKKLRRIGIYTVGQLASAPFETLTHLLGKIGEVLWIFANGKDVSEVKRFDSAQSDNVHVIKSIGNSMTTPRDLVCVDDVLLVIYLLAESVGMRLREAGFKCRVVAISVRNKELISFTRQRHIPKPTDLTKEIAEAAIDLFMKNYNFNVDMSIRSMGVRAMDLVPNTVPIQLDVFGNEKQRMRQERLEKAMDGLRQRFGNNAVRRCITLGDEIMTPMDIKRDNVIHPIGYFQPEDKD